MDVPAKFKFDKLAILESPNYVVHVGTVPGDKIPQYLIFHKEYGVLEFAHNMIYYINQALEEMEEKLVEQVTQSRMEDLPPIAPTTVEVAETTPVEARPARSTKKKARLN
jgi:hypothetical protein